MSVSAWQKNVLVIYVCVSMTGMCLFQNGQFQHGLNIEDKNASFSIAGMCCGQKCQFQHCWNMFWSKTTISA
jgi:hypothetical protein